MPTGRAFMMTLTGPTPAPFTGDRAMAQQFLDEFNQLVRTNLRHLLVSRPELRVELALQYVAKTPTTAAWRCSARSQSRDSGLTDETVWDNFYDSFCTAWTDDPILLPATTLPPPRPVLGSDEMTQTPPRPPRSPRRVSPTASPLDSVKPVNEPPQLLYAPIHPAPASLVSASAASEGPQTNNNGDAAESDDKDSLYEGSTPLLPPPALTASPTVPASVVEDDNSLERGVKTLEASVLSPDFTLLHPVSPVLPPRTPVYNSYDSPCRVLLAPNSQKRPRQTWRHHRPTRSVSPQPTAWFRTPEKRTPHSRDEAPQPARLASAARPQPRRHTQKSSTARPHRGGAPSLDSYSYSTHRRRGMAAIPALRRHLPRHAFEMPRDPDEVAPAAPRNQNHDAAAAPSTTDPAPRPSSSLRATAPVFTPRLPHTGPTQIHGVRLAMQIRTPAISHHFVRAATRIRDGHAYAAPPAMTRSRAEGTNVRPQRHSRNHAAAIVPRPTNPVTVHSRGQPTQTNGVQLTPQQTNPHSPPAPPRQRYLFRTQQTRQPRRDAADPSQPSATAASRIHTWLTQIVYEPLPNPYSRAAPATRDPVADECVDHAHRDYEYDDYRVSRREH
ncbi:hypothetical protein EDB85DRAFT_1893345 [Lactarius pseudohatsudake]|nr:hypothetical protein EDB85DRAFT_1893345 [Lactarius pseudohatsudake]